MPEIFKPKYISKETRVPRVTESEHMVTPEGGVSGDSFIVGQEVTVGRTQRDAEGNVIKGQVTLEAGWKVKSVDNESGIVVVNTPDGVYEKTYSVDKLRSFNPMSTAEVAAIERIVDAQTEALGRNAERHLSSEEFEELGEPAVEAVVEGPIAEAPNPWSKEAADARRRAEEPTRENPRMFDTQDGLVRLYEFPIGNGQMAEGIVAGVFSDEKGENIALVEQSGKAGYVEVPFSQLENKVVAKPEANPYADAAKQIITSAEVPKAVSEVSVQESKETDYDAWINGDIEGSVEDAAVRTLSDEERLTRERRAADATHNANNAYKRAEMQ